MGGGLAPRAAAFEPRIRALICIDGIYDIGQAYTARLGLWSFGVGTPRAYLAASLAYNLRSGIAEKITCPVFVGRAESDEFFRGQPEELMQHLTAPATLASFTD